MKKRFSLSLIAAAAFGLFACTNAQAGPNFIYNWGPPGGDTAIASDGGKFQMTILDEGNVPAGGATDSVAAGLHLSQLATGTPSDAFTNKSFKLGVVVQDGPVTSSALFFNVKFTSQVIGGSNPTTNTTLVSITPVGNNFMVVNGDTYTFTNPTWVTPGGVSQTKDGSIGFHIEQKLGDGGPNQPPPSDSPEPSTLLLGCFGLAGLGVRYWKKRNA